MKIPAALLIHCFLTSGLLAGFAGSNAVEVIWRAPTNDWPSSLWIYRVVPQSFSPAVVSNLLAMASFSMVENKSVPGQQVYEKDNKSVYFATPDEKRHLGISPTFGYIEYEDLSVAGDFNKPSMSVPSERDAYSLALDYLRQFGIDRSQLAAKPGTNDLAIRRLLSTRSWRDKDTHKEVRDDYEQGVFFVRRVDGVDVDGITHGGVKIVFGAGARISELKITWRGLEPFQLLPTCTPARIMGEIGLGHAKWLPSSPNDLRRITITGFTPFYRGQPGGKDPEEQQRYVEPYIVVYGSLDDSTNATCYCELPDTIEQIIRFRSKR